MTRHFPPNPVVNSFLSLKNWREYRTVKANEAKNGTLHILTSTLMREKVTRPNETAVNSAENV